MSEPTLMNPNPDPPRSTTPDRLDPARIRVVDVENESDGTVARFDCYEPGSEEKMFRLQGDEVQVRVLDWARSKDMDAEPEIHWVGTDVSVWDATRIRVFDWPNGDPIRVYTEIGE